MVITFATQKGGVGKTTLAVAFANYLTLVKNKKVKAFDFDFQKSFYQKWEEDKVLSIPPLYEVEVIGDENQESLLDFQTLMDMKKEEETVYLFDLAGTLDERYIDLLIYSDFIIIPFEYSDVSVKSTMVFINLLGMIESQASRVFVRSKYDKGYFYRNQQAMDEEFGKYGKLLSTPIYKRNDLQSINTRRLSYEQKNAVKQTFEELIHYINETI
ncbi:hypothetical protein RCZ04_06120 [Capnocytophaga sp. HP1101]